MKWVEHSNLWYKHWSVWGIALLGLLPFLEEHTHTISMVLPPHWQPYANLILAVVVGVLRFLKQSGIDRDEQN